ncbi:MAG: maleylpyruvate isomerase N-terminal domain-containing protein [Janibacter sp.]
MDGVADHWLAPEVYLEAIERETRRFRECLAGADPGSRVPTCPDWDVDDLLWHLGGEVQGFWAWVIGHRPERPDEYAEPARPRAREALLGVLDHAHQDLMLRLRNADPAEGAWSWHADPRLHTVGFTMRRQAHEALIHRVDAELAVGDRTAIDPRLAADGMVECLDWMYGEHPSWGTYVDDGTRVVVHASDTGRRVLLGLGRFTGHDPDEAEDVDEDDLRVIDAAVHGSDPGWGVTITGTAEQIDLWLWHRGSEHLLDIDGDDEVRARIAAILGQSID